MECRMQYHIGRNRTEQRTALQILYQHTTSMIICIEQNIKYHEVYKFYKINP
jgi:hypothetical protein